ncbi:hypothetical protein [Propionivibrio sp.]|uniref:hypothetical protein n=1 Tax=Propionivibrio sp. TaxID=2212460 RepID=UPI00261871F3|nr:hypothetical protein [Propionivibrio sp.]
MLKHSVIATALAAALNAPLHAVAADDQTLAQIRAEIRQMKESYEARIEALEQRLQASEAKAALPQTAAAPPSATRSGNGFNPDIALILGGTYARLSQDPGNYRIQGFVPGGNEIGPGKRSFNLGESELTLSANVDPRFSGKLTFSLSPENQVSVEEAFFDSIGLVNGVNLKGGRFLSSVGYLNGQHAHTWDFVDAPLVYQAMFGDQYKPDGLQLKWLAPTERFFEVGMEAGNGAAFPGNDRNKNGVGSASLFGHVGDDLGESSSWRAGLAYLRTGAANRSYSDLDHTASEVSNSFDGKSRLWIVDGVYKWAPSGNATHTNFKLQGEYFWRKEDGTLVYDSLAQSLGSASLPFSSAQSGWYMQGVYQFLPAWRFGLRYDRLNSGAPKFGFEGSALGTIDFQRLSPYQPTRSSMIFDYSPSEFSRFRLQLAQDKSRPEVTDKQIFLQYIMSLGAHGAHSF